MIRYTFKSLGPIALYLSIVMLFHCCDSKNDVEFYNCVGDLPIDEFYFMGEHDNFHVEIYDKNYEYYSGETKHASLIFNEDKTFKVIIEFKCDSTENIYPLCDSLNLNLGLTDEMVWAGTWDFNQNIKTISSDCGWFSLRCDTNEINGECNLNVLNSPFEKLNNEISPCDFYVTCWENIGRIYWMDIWLPLENEYQLFFQIGFEENVN